jgi:hypothetical protein
MMQVIEMTHSEKVEMYQMVEKDKLIEMLIEGNNVINRLTEEKNLRIANVSGSLPCHHNYIPKDIYWKNCTHCGMIAPLAK